MADYLLKLVRVSHFNEHQDWITEKIKFEWWDEILKLIKNLRKNPKNIKITDYMKEVKKNHDQSMFE